MQILVKKKMSNGDSVITPANLISKNADAVRVSFPGSTKVVTLTASETLSMNSVYGTNGFRVGLRPTMKLYPGQASLYGKMR